MTQFQKYDWQKPHQPNQTGTDNSYHPNKYNEKKTKNIKVGKNNFFFFYNLFF